MREFIIAQAKQIAIWYSTFVLMEFVLPVMFLTVNIPTIEALTKSLTSNDPNLITQSLIHFFLVQIIYEAVWRFRDFVKIKCSVHLKRNSFNDLSNRILNADLKFFSRYTPVELTNVMRNIGDSLERLFIIMAKVFRYFAYIVFIPFKVLQIDHIGALIMVIWISIWLAGSVYLFGQTSNYTIKLSNVKNRTLALICEVVMNIENIFVYKTYNIEEANIKRNIAKFIKCDNKVQFSFWKLWVLQGVYFSAFPCMIIFVLMKSMKLSASNFVILYKMISDLIELMWSSSEYIFDFVEHYGKVRNGFNVLSNSMERKAIPAMTKTDQSDAGKIVFNGVKFIEDDKIVCEFDATIARNQFVALIGHSGSGKTMFAKMILHLSKPTQGKITNTITSTSFAYAQQYITVFRNTVRYNLTYGLDREVSDDEIRDVLTGVNCDFIENNSSEYNNIIDPRKLSVGQIQKLSIARAILADADITIFDEPTSALDLKSEKYVMQSIYKMKKTKIVIAHKIHTIKNADQILIFDNGKIVASGNDKSLKYNEYYSALM